ncbi:MAG: hypothetical protein WBB73_07595 [Candidatus Aminicenantaceae bacterium]
MKDWKYFNLISNFIAKFTRTGSHYRGLSTFGIAVLVALTIPAGPVIDQMSTMNGDPPAFYAGRNVNMVADDILLQRQNEPSIAVSTDNPDFLLAGANDYRTVDMPGEPGEEITGDAWLGVFISKDGGESWKSDLLPPYDTERTPSPLAGFDAAADPTVTAGIDGKFIYSGIAFDRIENGDSVIFVSRFHDTGSDIAYDDTTIIDSGTSGQFSDKPWNAIDIPRGSTSPHGVYYIVYSVFLGSSNPNNNIHSRIMVSRSLDGGETWLKPIKISEGELKNQGTIMAIDPSDGTVYVAWRRFASSSAMDAILIAKSEDFGKTFTKAEEVANIARPFDQSTIGGAFHTDPAQFRTNAFPSLAVDHSGRVYLAWSQRDVATGAYADDARIVLTSQAKGDWGNTWVTAQAVEQPGGFNKILFAETDEIIHSHQFMPTLTYGAGKLMIAWFDNRYSARVVNQYGELRSVPCLPGESVPIPGPDRIMDYLYECDQRETIDVRAAVAIPSGTYPNFSDSIQVSRYVWVLEDTGNPDAPYRPVQGQYNPPNYKLFSGGTMPFHGDYIDITTAPMMVKSGGNWRFSDIGDPLIYYVTWTDNRDVLPPDNNIWTNYTPPAYDPDCAGYDSGMRNQNVYVSKLTQGIEAAVQGNFEQSGQQVFVITLQNSIDSPEDPIPDPDNPGQFIIPLYKSFTFEILSAPDVASFYPGPAPDGYPAQIIDVDVPDHSTVSRMVFVNAAAYQIEVRISEFITGTFTETLFLSPEGSNSIDGPGTFITEMQTIDWTDPPYNPKNPDAPSEKLLANPNILTPNILTPNILTPNILTPNILTPNILTPNILTPNILTPNILTPNILTPNILTPNILTQSILNPNILTPNILTTPPPDGTQVVDKIWNVTNNTGAVSSFTFKSIAGDKLPAGVVGMQLLIFKEHTTPSTDGCTLKDQVQHELLVNISNPNIIDYIDLNNLKKILGDPNIDFENAAFSLGPYENALVVFRVIDVSPQKPGASSRQLYASTDPEDPTTTEEFADNLGAVVVAHSSTEETPQSTYNALTLQILPSGLSDGYAGAIYPEQKIIAIGGAGDYSWSIKDGSLPAGLAYSIEDLPDDDPDFGNIVLISGLPRQSGHFEFVFEVVSDGDSDTQRFSIDLMAPEYPLQVTMTPNLAPPEQGYLAPSATKDVFYTTNGDLENPTFLTFEAWGGIPLSDSGAMYNWALLDAPSGLDLFQFNGAEGSEFMQLKGTPLIVGNYTVTVQVNDDYLPDDPEERPVSISFELCVLPPDSLTIAPLEDGEPISCASALECTLPDAEIGAEYDELNVTLNAPNRESGTRLDWELISGKLPVGLDFHPLLPDTGNVTADFLEIVGTPTFDGDFNYPKSYGPIKVKLTETYAFESPSGGVCSGEREAEIDLTININPKGKAWAFLEGGFEGAASDVTLDEDGNVYITGFVEGTDTGQDYYIVKYDATGNLDWPEPVIYDGPGDDAPTAVAIDATGIYVTGGSDGGNSGQDIYTVKYDLDNGHVIWSARYDGPSHLGDGANAIALDEGFIYVVGYVHRGNQSKHADYVLIKYDKFNGDEEWDETYDSTKNGNDIATAVAVDRFGNVYMTGKSQPVLKTATSHDFFTVKYNSSGRLQWDVRDDGLGFGDDEPTALALWEDSGGQVYAYVTGSTGTVVGSALSKDFYTVMYDASGAEIWAHDMKGTGNGDDVAISISIDESGNAYVTGKSYSPSGDVYAVIKYGFDGSQPWQDSGFETLVGDDAGVAVAYDAGQVYMAGFMTTPDGGADLLILAYNVADGSILWFARYPLPENSLQGDEIATAMVVDATGIYVTGFSLQGGISRMITVKFDR